MATNLLWHPQQIWPPIFRGNLNKYGHLSSVAPSTNMATNLRCHPQQIWLPIFRSTLNKYGHQSSVAPSTNMATIWTYGGLPLLGIGCPALDIGVIYFAWKIEIINVRLPRMFLFTYFFLKKELDKLLWASIISGSHTELRMISRSVPGLVTYFPLWCLEQHMNHLHPVWWSTFGFIILSDSCCASLVQLRGILYWFLVFIHVFINYPSFVYYFPFSY